MDSSNGKRRSTHNSSVMPKGPVPARVSTQEDEWSDDNSSSDDGDDAAVGGLFMIGEQSEEERRVGVVVSKEAGSAQVEGEPILDARGHVEQPPLLCVH